MCGSNLCWMTSLNVGGFICRAVSDPRTSKRVALKKLLNVFHSLVSCRRAFRELSMLFELKHENVSQIFNI